MNELDKTPRVVYISDYKETTLGTHKEYEQRCKEAELAWDESANRRRSARINMFHDWD